MFICSFCSYISSYTSSTKFRLEENLNTCLSFISNFKIMLAVKYFVSVWQFMLAKCIITRNKFCSFSDDFVLILKWCIICSALCIPPQSNTAELKAENGSCIMLPTQPWPVKYSVCYTCPVTAVHEHTCVLCHHFMSAVQPAAVVACSLNICRVNTNSTKAPFLRANTGKYSV